MKTYDYLIIGAGVSGCASGYFLAREGKSVAIIDAKENLFDGASGAAGAFLSPMLGSANPVRTTVNTALLFALDFYEKNVPNALNKQGVLRILEDSEEFASAKKYDSTLEFPFTFLEHPSQKYPSVKDDGFGGYFFENGAILDTKKTLEFFTRSCNLYLGIKVQTIEKNGEDFVVSGIRAKNLIFAQGYESTLIPTPYFRARPIWGQRIEIRAENPPPCNIHKGIGISCVRNDVKSFAIGATKVRNRLDPSTDESDTRILLEKALSLYDLKNPQVLEVYSGIRSSAVDYLPVCGKLIDFEVTTRAFPTSIHGFFPRSFALCEIENCYIINALGARGFVYAPLVAKTLSDYILYQREIPDSLALRRLYTRWCKKEAIKYFSKNR